jgi:hypothetical protein
MTREEIANAQLKAVYDHLVLQFGSVLFLVLAYMVAALILVFVLCDLRRCALAAFFLFGFLTFVVPTPITALVSPMIMFLSIAGIAWITWAGRVGRNPGQ